MSDSYVKLAIFDLDGTLINSLPDIANCINLVLSDLGYPKQREYIVQKCIGNGIHRLIIDIFSSINNHYYNDDTIDYAYNLFLYYYEKKLISKSTLYPAVKETIEELILKNIKIACVTNKNGSFTFPLLEHFNLVQYFSIILPGESLNKKKPDPYPLIHACNKLGIKKNDSIMVGDSVIDIHAANNAGIKCGYVSYGYGDNMNAIKLKPDYYFSSFHQILEVV